MPLPDETVSIESLVPEVLVLARSVSLLAIKKCASPQPREEAYSLLSVVLEEIK